MLLTKCLPLSNIHWCYVSLFDLSHFVIPVALCNNFLSDLVIPAKLFNKIWSHFVIATDTGTVTKNPEHRTQDL